MCYDNCVDNDKAPGESINVILFKTKNSLDPHAPLVISDLLFVIKILERVLQIIYSHTYLNQIGSTCHQVHQLIITSILLNTMINSHLT
jgi:hypothetical protein